MDEKEVHPTRDKNEIDDSLRITEDTSSQREGKKKGIWTLLAFLFAILMKGKFIIVFILTKLKFLLIFLKLGKFASTAVSMVLTIGIYASVYGIRFALGIVGLLFVHEMGHYVVAKRIGLNVTGPVFIPFVGALIGMKEEPKNAVMEAQVGYGGPLFGSMAAVICLLVYWKFGSELALVLAYVGFLLNLFNLLPIHPLDGGRIVSAVSPYLWLIGLPILGYLIIDSFSPILLLIIILGIAQLYKLWKNRKELSVYYEVPFKERVQFAILYFGLVGTLGIGTSYTLDILK